MNIRRKFSGRLTCDELTVRDQARDLSGEVFSGKLFSGKMFHSGERSVSLNRSDFPVSDPVCAALSLRSQIISREMFIHRPNGRLASIEANRRARRTEINPLFVGLCPLLCSLFFQKTRVFVGGGEGRARKFAESGEPPCEVPFVRAYEHPCRKWRGNYVSSLARASVITFPSLLVT
jgi:hypothetical protein